MFFVWLRFCYFIVRNFKWKWKAFNKEEKSSIGRNINSRNRYWSLTNFWRYNHVKDNLMHVLILNMQVLFFLFVINNIIYIIKIITTLFPLDRDPQFFCHLWPFKIWTRGDWIIKFLLSQSVKLNLRWSNFNSHLHPFKHKKITFMAETCWQGELDDFYPRKTLSEHIQGNLQCNLCAVSWKFKVQFSRLQFKFQMVTDGKKISGCRGLLGRVVILWLLHAPKFSLCFPILNLSASMIKTSADWEEKSNDHQITYRVACIHLCCSHCNNFCVEF